MFLHVTRSEEPSQPKEPPVTQKELTPPQPAQVLVSRPSSQSSTTLGTTTTITTEEEEEMSEGELIQVSVPLPSPPLLMTLQVA